MPNASIEALESRTLLSAATTDGVFLSFSSNLEITITAGQTLPPIIVRALGPGDRVVRSFTGPVSLELAAPGTTPIATTQFKHGIAVFRGFRYTTAGARLIYAQSGTLSSGDAVSVNVTGAAATVVQLVGTQFENLSSSVPGEIVDLAAYDRFGNRTDDVHFNVMLGKTSPTSVPIQLQGIDGQGIPIDGVIFRHGHAVAVRGTGGNIVNILFPNVPVATVETTSVELVFSNKKIKPIWTPLYQPPES